MGCHSLFPIHRSSQAPCENAQVLAERLRYGACWTGWHDMREFFRKPGKMAVL